MPRTKGSKNRSREDQVRLAQWLTCELQAVSGMSPPELEVELLGEDQGGRKWRRWSRGEVGMASTTFHRITSEAVERGWLYPSTAAKAGLVQTTRAESASAIAEEYRRRQVELKMFTQAKAELLKALTKYSSTCKALTKGRPGDVGVGDLQNLQAEEDLEPREREALARLEGEELFKSFPSPALLKAQLQRQRLFFDDNRLSPGPARPGGIVASKRPVHVSIDELAEPNDRDAEMSFGSGSAYAQLVELSSQRRRAERQQQLRRLEAMVDEVKFTAPD
jgi:hypothetical protein